MSETTEGASGAGAAGPRQGRALAFIFFVVLIDMIGFGIVIPVLPDLIMDLTGVTVARAATLGGLMLFVYAGMQFVCAPIVGAASDRFGRRPVLLLAMLGFAIDYTVMGVANTIVWLFLARGFSGLFGATFSTAGAYIADVSPPDKRAGNFGLIGAAFGLGFILGPVIGGLASLIDTRAPFFAAAGLACVNLVFGLFVLPESLKPESRRAFVWARANPLGALLHLRARPVVIGLVGVSLIFYVAHDSLPAVWAYFAIEKFQWTAADIGWSLGFVGLTAAIVQGGLTRVIEPRLGARMTVTLALAILAATFLGYAFAPNGIAVYVWIAIGAFAGLAGPAMQGVMSNATPSDEQGELQGALTSTMSIAAVMSPPLMTLIFTEFTKKSAVLYLPGAPFVLAAGLTCVSLAIFLAVCPKAQAA